MRRKYIVLCMYFLTCICIVSVGFSSWTIVQNANIKAFGSFASSEIISHSDYIEFESMQGFKYCSAGFLNNDLSKADKGTCTANLNIKLNNCAIQFQGKDSLKVVVEFRYESSCDYNIFKSSNMITHDIVLNEGHRVEDAIVSRTEDTNLPDYTFYRVEFVLINYLKDYRALNSIIENEDLIIQIHFGLTSDEFAIAYPSIEDMQFQCNLKIEGC